MTRDESRDVFILTNSLDEARANGYSEHAVVVVNDCGMGITKPCVRFSPHSDLESVERERDAALDRVMELERELRDEEERHATLQSRCYEGFPTATDGIFDALNELEPLAKAYREIGEAKLERDRTYRIWYDESTRESEIQEKTLTEYVEAVSRLGKELDRAAEFAKKGGE